MTQNLSRAAKSALINAHPREGAAVDTVTVVMDELRAAGLVRERGLTGQGVLVRRRIVDAALDAAFN